MDSMRKPRRNKGSSFGEGFICYFAFSASHRASTVYGALRRALGMFGGDIWLVSFRVWVRGVRRKAQDIVLGLRV